jgi:hypothetical protein
MEVSRIVHGVDGSRIKTNGRNGVIMTRPKSDVVSASNSNGIYGLWIESSSDNIVDAITATGTGHLHQ